MLIVIAFIHMLIVSGIQELQSSETDDEWFLSFEVLQEVEFNNHC